MINSPEGTAISFPFSVDTSGSIATATNDTEIWENRVRIVILTNLTERVMRPDFGSRIAGLIYENNYSTTRLAEQVVSAAFSKWLPTLTLQSVVCIPDDVNGGLIVQVNYNLPSGIAGSVLVSQKTATINRYGDIVQGA